MALTGHLSDLSLSELIEFFCNQRKTGSLKVLYPDGAGYFYLQTGSVVDAKIGVLRGIDAVYYALTLPNAKFEFSATSEPIERTINQPWTQVVLEGLRRLDEGIVPAEAFPAGYGEPPKESEPVAPPAPAPVAYKSHVPNFFATFMSSPTVSRRKPILLGAVSVAVLASVAVIGVPAGWYRHKPVSVPQNETVAGSSSPEPVQPVAEQPVPTESVEPSHADEDAQVTARRQRDRERKQREEKAAAAPQPTTVTSPASAASPADSARGPKRVVVTVTYDESGRVTQASGGDATALRIARQKRFPAGKAGSATVTIPIN